jgi:hypothetical protein
MQNFFHICEQLQSHAHTLKTNIAAPSVNRVPRVLLTCFCCFVEAKRCLALLKHQKPTPRDSWDAVGPF